MFKVKCTLPNASTLISGVVFAPAEEGDGMVSEDVTEEVAAGFAGIPGYTIIPAGKSAPRTDATPATGKVGGKGGKKAAATDQAPAGGDTPPVGDDTAAVAPAADPAAPANTDNNSLDLDIAVESGGKTE